MFNEQQGLEKNLQETGEAYISSLPEKIVQLEEVWQVFRQDDYQDAYSKLEQLRFLAHGLNNSEANSSYSGLTIKARMLELFLKSLFENSSSVPLLLSPGQVARVEALLKEVKQAASQATPPQVALTPKNTKPGILATPSTWHLKGASERQLVFILEEDLELAQKLVRNLERAGYSAHSFKDVIKLKQAAIQDEPMALILSQVCFEQQAQGVEVLNLLRSESLSPLTIIFSSEQNDLVARLKAVQVGGHAFLVKPFEFDELITKLNELTIKRIPTPYRIMLVEDDIKLLQTYILILEQAGMVVQATSDLTILISTIAEFQPDLVMIDIYRDDCNGLELAVVIRQHKDCLNLPIVFLSGEVNLNKQSVTMNLGGADFLTKPIEPEYLIQMINARAERGRVLQNFNKEVELQVVERTTTLAEAGEQLMVEVARRRRMEEDLKESSRRMVSILESITDGFFALDRHWCFTYLNPQAERILQHSQEELLGKNIWKEMPEAASLVFFEETRAVIGEWKAFSGEGFYPPLKAWFEVRAYPYREGVAVYLHDITARKCANEEMWKALEKEHELNDLKSRFISTASHEFRTPLSTILSSSELLERYDQKWSNEKKRELYQRIQDGVKRMTGLLNDVLLISKSDAGKLEFNPNYLNLTQFCQQMVEEFQLGTTSNHKINFNQPTQAIEGGFDERLLQSIISNLLSNAVKYSPDNKTVYFSLVPRHDEVVLEVRDEGIGIPLEDQAHLFGVFYRAKNVGTISGTGLGLSIVKRSVELHQGSVRFASQTGQGTTFTIILPWNSSLNQIKPAE